VSGSAAPDPAAARRGRFIVLEGGDGVGKTTQLPRLVAALVAQGIDVRTIREPGGTPAGDAIRALLLDPGSDLEPRSELLLFLAARAQVVHDVIRPALDAGTWVVADRFFVSTYAYQGAGHGLPLPAVQGANALATGGLVPDLTLVLTVDAATAAARRASRGAGDRMERHGAAFAARVEAAYREALSPDWQRAHPECGPIVGVDADGTPDEVTARLVAIVVERTTPLVTLIS
jgi:dTMP kinase